MSTEVTNFIDISLDTIEVTKDNAIMVTSSSPYEVTPQNVDAVVEGYKKEYSIVGDDIYASVSADEAPSWLLGLIDAVVTASVANGMVDYDLLVQDVYNAIDSIDVAKNTFVTQVDITPLVDGIVASHLQTLNATIGNTYATKVELSTALATSEAALAQDITDLSVSFNDELNSRITSVQTAYANADSALADDITALETAFEDQEGNLSATATAVSGLQTYVGLDNSNNPDGTGLLISVSNLQKAADGLLEIFAGSHFVVTNATDGDIDTNELITNQWPYALWLPMEGTVDPTATTRIAYKDMVSDSYAIPEFTLYKNTTANTFWEYLPTTGTGWEEILETEYNSRTTVVRDAHLGDTFIRYTADNEYAESYKFILTDVDTSSPLNTDSDGYCWALVVDTAANAAYTKALEAQGAADGKISQFYAWGGTSAPASYTADGFTIEADNFKYWYKTDGKLYYKPNTTWILVPTSSDTSGSTYVAEGDLLVVFDPTNRDITNYSYNGISWQINGPNGVISKSKFFVDLENEVTGPTGHVATSLAELEVSSSAYADALAESVESKFAYNSNIAIDGLYYSSGFGLNAVGSSGSGTELDPFDSEFWVNAERFVLKSPTYPGIEASFQVTPSGIKLDSDMIVDGSITTNKLSVADFSGNLVGNGSFAYDDARGWEPLPATMFTTTLADRKCLAMATTAADSVLRATPDTPITPGDELSIRFFGAASSGGSATIRVNVVFYRTDGSYLSGYWSFGQTFSNTTWTEYSSGTTQIVAPAEAAFVRFVIRRVAGGTGTGYITGIEAVRRRAGSTIITPNSITSDNLAANSVTANALATNSVTTDSLAASSITADKLNVTDLSAISANLGTIQVDTANIADLSIETLKIADQAISNTSIDEATITFVDNTYVTVASLTLPTYIGSTTIVQTGGTAILGSGGETGITFLDMRILKDGIEIAYYPNIIATHSTTLVIPNTIDSDISSASSTTYSTQIRRSSFSGEGTVIFNGKIVVTELKR